MTDPDLDDYDAVVYDLDGTLVRLDVDWPQVRQDVGELFERHGIDYDPVDWDMLDVASEHGLREQTEFIVANHEVAGARNSHRLALADELVGLSMPAGVCSLNCERACHVALEAHDLASAVDVIVGRDSVSSRKPDPEPLLAALASLGVEPGRALFVGDSPGDGTAAERAGVTFRAVPGSDAAEN